MADSVATDHIREHVASLVGVVLYATAGVYVAIAGGTVGTLALETALPVAVGTGLLWYDRRSESDEVDNRSVVVGLAALGCGGVVAVLSVWSLSLVWLRTGISTGGLQPMVSAVSIGAGLGTVLGHVYVERTHQYRENDRLSRAVDASMDGIAIVADGKYRYVNDAYAALYGVTDGATLDGRHWKELYTADASARLEREGMPALAEHHSWRGTLTGTRHDGTTFPLEVTISTLDDGCVVVARDVSTDRDREQRIQVLNRVLRHNLRNAFTVIQGHAALIRERDDELGEQHVDPIMDELNDLLETADKARGIEQTLKSDDRTTLVEAPEAVRAAVSRAQNSYPDVQIVSQIDDDDGEPPAIDERIIDALNELIDNAVEHHDDVPTVDVCYRTVAYGADPIIEFTVADDGCGIPELERQTVRAGRETPLEHGSGLGLWLVTWIVANASGELHFDDRPGGGTVVTLTFPIEQGKRATTDPEQSIAD